LATLAVVLIAAMGLGSMATLGGLGCVGGSKSSKANAEALKQYVLDAAPEDIPNKLGTDFDGKAKLLGYKITPEKDAKPGTEVRLTMYWECTDDIPDGWNLFTHVTDGGGKTLMNIDQNGPLRRWVDNKQVLSPSLWKKGKVYVDEQTFTLHAKLDASELVIVTGIWKGDARMKVTAGQADRENRAIVAKLNTGLPAKASPAKQPHAGIKTIRVPKLAKGDTIKIDGKLDDEAWKKAITTGPLVDVSNGEMNREFPVQGSVRMIWDDKNLYVAFEVQSSTVVGGFPANAKDPHLWEKDTVEIMIDPDGDGDNKDYYEIQINPQNLVFDTQYDDYNQPRDVAKGIFGNMSWSSKVKSAVIVEGEMDKEGAARGYVVEAAIPWASFTKAKQSPPKANDQWRMNFYAMKNNSGLAWSPILGQGNFHRASRFGRVIWVDGE